MAAEGDLMGRVIAGRYALRGVLGRGGMGVVWLATDRVLEREVALKEVTFSLAQDQEERRVLLERTMREARAAARLDHPCVATVYDVVEEHGKPWLVMERVEAVSLQEVLEESGPVSPRAAARIGLDVLAALEAAHGVGIVHRDVKPANVLVGRDGHAHLTDFGIATSTGDSSLTTRGSFIGSPAYMAPERAGGQAPSPEVDLWSLGATLYAAVEGRPPFDRDEPLATLAAVLNEHPAPALRAGPLEPVIAGLLTKDPAERTRPDLLRSQLETVLASGDTPSSAPPPPPVQRQVSGGSMVRIDADDLRSLASASRAVLGSVARDARDEARYLVEKRREKRRGQGVARRPRWRFKKRWVLVPLVVVLIVVVAVLVGVVYLVAHGFGG